MSPHGERRVLRCSARSIWVHAGFSQEGERQRCPHSVANRSFRYSGWRWSPWARRRAAHPRPGRLAVGLSRPRRRAALGSERLRQRRSTAYGVGCDGAGGDLTRRRHAASLAGGRPRAASFTIPTNTALSAVRVQRAATVPAGVKYEASLAGTSLESSTGADARRRRQDLRRRPGDSGNSVTLKLSCDGAPAPRRRRSSLDVGRVGLKVADTGSADSQKPTFAVGGAQPGRRHALARRPRQRRRRSASSRPRPYFERRTVADAVAVHRSRSTAAT